jgi:transcriptional regulator with XRE-family HTH domain
MDLATFLEEKVQQSSYRQVEQLTGVSRGSLENIIRRRNTEPPELPTLEKLATAYDLPVWRIAEMAGHKLEVPTGHEAALLLQEGMQNPELAELIEIARQLTAEKRKALVSYAQYLRDR